MTVVYLERRRCNTGKHKWCGPYTLANDEILLNTTVSDKEVKAFAKNINVTVIDVNSNLILLEGQYEIKTYKKIVSFLSRSDAMLFKLAWIN